MSYFLNQSICNLLNLNTFSPCVIDTNIDEGILTIYFSPTVSRTKDYYKQVNKEIIKKIRKILNLKFLTTEILGHSLLIKFEVKDVDELITFFKMFNTETNIQKVATTAWVNKLPDAPDKNTMYFIMENEE